MESQNVQPFTNCPALDGCHCQTNSLAKIFHHAGHPMSEDMLLGLGAGQGFFFWHQKGAWVHDAEWQSKVNQKAVLKKPGRPWWQKWDCANR
jgi:hypothetical protein